MNFRSADQVTTPQTHDALSFQRIAGCGRAGGLPCLLGTVGWSAGNGGKTAGPRIRFVTRSNERQRAALTHTYRLSVHCACPTGDSEWREADRRFFQCNSVGLRGSNLVRGYWWCRAKGTGGSDSNTAGPWFTKPKGEAGKETQQVCWRRMLRKSGCCKISEWLEKCREGPFC